MIVLSLFDGMACGYEALKRAGIPVTKYYASEIDKWAMQIAKKNHPDIIHLGDVTDWDLWDIEKPDLIIGGSPCQGFSFAGKQLAFDDPRSKLFFEMVDIINYFKPTYWFLENVKMKQEFLDVITSYMNCGDPHFINSALVSAQNRQRYYWYNWGAPDPQDKGILLKDIVHEFCDCDRDKSYCIDANYYKGANWEQYKNKSRRQMVLQGLAEYIVPFDKTLQILDKEVEKGKIGYFGKDCQSSRVYYVHDKAVTLCGNAGGGGAKMGQYLFGCITPERVNKRQNGQRFNDGQKFYTLTAQDKHRVLVEGYIRKLTPIECERLQTLPDNYTLFDRAEIIRIYGDDGKIKTKEVFPVSNTQRYRMLGNGWTVDVIAHLFRYMI